MAGVGRGFRNVGRFIDMWVCWRGSAARPGAIGKAAQTVYVHVDQGAEEDLSRSGPTSRRVS
jgi:hypothetical protein